MEEDFERDNREPRSRQAMALGMNEEIERKILEMLHGVNPGWENFKARLDTSRAARAVGESRDKEFPSLGEAKQRRWAPKVPHRPFAVSAKEQRARELPLRYHLQSGGRLDPFIEKRPQSLRPLLGAAGEWEWVEAILDSGATVAVIPVHVGAGYDVTEGEASKAGVKYEVANGEEIPNLGEKLMAIMTAEGSVRGMLAQVADVSKPLQAVRSLVRAGHVVVFGDGENGDENYIYNKFSGETTAVTDDGINYLMGMWIIPPGEASQPFGRQRPQVP